MTVLALTDVTLRRDGHNILSDISWTVDRGEMWVVLGRNGSGKTSLARIASLWEHPSSGTVEVLGERLGRTDVRTLRRRVSLVSAAMADLIRPQITAVDVVMCAKYAALEPWWHSYSTADRERALSLLSSQGIGSLGERRFATLSSGERQRTLLARSLMAEPALVILDEPAAGLDLGGREDLVDAIDAVASDPAAPPVVLVTHHLEEIPSRATHLLGLAEGRVIARGPIGTQLTEDFLCRCFGVEVTMRRHRAGSGLRYSAHRDDPPGPLDPA